MPELQPAFVTAGNNYGGGHFRRMFASAFQKMKPAGQGGADGGVVGENDLAVTAGAGLTTSVAIGHAIIWSTVAPFYNGVYGVTNDTAVTKTHAAADPTNPRIDLIVAHVFEPDNGDVNSPWALEVVAGTPSATPAPPTPPANSLILAEVSIAANAAAVGAVTDRRFRACAAGGVGYCTWAKRPGAPLLGQTVYLTDSKAQVSWDGAAWKGPGRGALGTTTVTVLTPNVAQTKTQVTAYNTTVTVPPGQTRRLRARLEINPVNNATNGIEMYIQEGTTALRQRVISATINLVEEMVMFVEFDAAPGAHTYSCWIRSQGGSMYLYGDANGFSGRMVIEDIGAA